MVQMKTNNRQKMKMTLKINFKKKSIF